MFYLSEKRDLTKSGGGNAIGLDFEFYLFKSNSLA